ncbi:MAG: tRNA uridine-5-carboxymethylaminomethyl(34) synthesis GTPase MnmE [Alphaproteobacteria bacterium]|nr:tRNA uridine-5-carboxymethylaminomethyl(34) synthesis GTPase MnmE [Alphaproteobacteria bacterium]
MASTSTSADTIFALSSAPGRAGVAVIRLSGPQTATAVETLCGALPPPRQAVLRRLLHPTDGTLIDRGLVLYFPSPGTFTGEDIAEFQVHGGRAVIVALLSALGNLPRCRLAEPGEFAMRAFHNGKLDLAQAEGLADLIDAETEAQRRQALNQAEGALSQRTEKWRTALIEAMSLVEAAIDFSDEADVSDNAVAQAEKRIAALAAEIAGHLDDCHRGEILRDGFKVVLAGAPNVGKSSLLNALARRDVAIVSSEAGTTRDTIEVRLDLGGLPVIVTDTAGLREAAGEIEQEGIRRTLARAQDAHLVLWVIDASSQGKPDALPKELEDKPTIVVANKCDLLVPNTDTAPTSSPRRRGSKHASIETPISAKTGTGLETLVASIAAEAARSTEGAQADGVITQARHRRHLGDCLEHVSRFLQGAPEIELRAEDLRLAADSLGRITGRIDPEDILDQVFGRFCIGK